MPSYQQQLKTIYQAGNEALTEARAIMDEFKGGNIPAEKQGEVDALLDIVEAKEADAKRVERLMGADSFYSEASQHLPLGGGGDAPKSFGGAISPDVKSLAQMAGYDDSRIKATPFRLDDGERYDPDRAIKQAVATALYWKHGKELGEALNRLPTSMRKMGRELKALATSPGAAGGYLVGDHQRGAFIEELEDLMAMRRISNVLPPIPGGQAVTPAEDSSLSDAEWTSEVSTGSEDTVNPFGNRSLTPHPLAKRIKISSTLLRASTLLNVESYVIRRSARKHREPQENAFINGSGAQQPLGLLTASGIASTTTAASNVLAAEDLVNWVYQLDARYMGDARIICNQSFIRKVRLMRSDSGAGAGTGQFLWQPGLQQGAPSMIMDYPYELSSSYPTGLDGSDVYEDNALVATIGDFSYYWIVDSLFHEVQRLDELYAESNQVGFISRTETDGMPVKAEAFRHLKIKA